VTYIAGGGVPDTATQTNANGAVTWGTTETTIISTAVNRTGYFHVCAQLIILSGSGDNQEIRLRAAGTQIDIDTIPANAERATRMLTPSAPVLMSNGQAFTLTGRGTVNPANNQTARTMVTWAFVPTPTYPA
jgi:hypothetical protein